MHNSEQFFGSTLVLGAGGFVGRALVPHLMPHATRVAVVTRQPIHLFVGVEEYVGDLTDATLCATILADVDTVFYLAGYKKNIAHHIQFPFDFVQGNVQPLLTFLSAVRTASVKRIIYLSTTHAIDEWQLKTDGYAVGKHMNELILETFANQNPVTVNIIRSCGVYGPGDSFDPQVANFIPALIRRVDECQDTLDVWGSGERKMQYIYIDDLVANLLAAPASSTASHIIGNPEVVSVHDIVTLIMDALEKECVIHHDLLKPDKVTRLFEFDNRIAPQVSLQTGIVRTVEYYKSINTHE